MKNSNFKENIQPTLVLVVICLVMTFLLAFVNGITSPIIASNSEKAANANRALLLPEADGFEAISESDLYTQAEGQVWVEDCYKATNGAGYVMTVKTKSFGGILTEMIGVDSTGAITGVKVTAHGDTKGLGTKAHDSAYLDSQYVGKTALDNAANIKQDVNVEHVSGASISSNGVYQGVCCALTQIEKLGGAN